jgi:hypothetical protein
MTEANNHISALTAFNLAAISAALVLLGPGSFSLDARLFGRREIIIPEGRVQLVDDSQKNSRTSLRLNANSCPHPWASNPPK